MIRTILLAGASALALGATGVEAKTFSYTGALDSFTAPTTGVYEIDVWGAAGGTSGFNEVGGRGVGISGDFTLTNGEQLTIAVGGLGAQGRYLNTRSVYWNGGAGGGGGSFVVHGTTALIIAGGGGGASTVQTGQDATVSSSGISGASAFGYSGGAGGAAGNGGAGGSAGYSGGGGGGGGFLSNGKRGGGGGAYGGFAFSDLRGGLGSGGGSGGQGGFGGGGGGGNTGNDYAYAGGGGGGGGGYSGGGGGAGGAYLFYGSGVGGGGGGSFNAGAHPTLLGYDSGNGSITITQLSNAVPEPSTWSFLLTGLGLLGFALRRRLLGPRRAQT